MALNLLRESTAHCGDITELLVHVFIERYFHRRMDGELPLSSIVAGCRLVALLAADQLPKALQLFHNRQE